MIRWLRLATRLAAHVGRSVARRLRGERAALRWTALEELVLLGMREVVPQVFRDIPFVRQIMQLPQPPLLGSGVTRSTIELAGRPAALVPRVPRPAPTGPTRTLLYFHGGGYAVGSPQTHRDLLVRLTRATGCRVVALDYRKAPEDPFPAALDDALAACAALRRGGVTDLWLGGDSAGGGLAACTLQALRDRGLPLPSGAILLSPWADLTPAGHAPELEGPVDYITPAVLDSYARHYLAGHDATHPHISPVFADLSGLPPVLVQVGEVETMRDQGERYAARAQAAGSPVQLDVVEGMVHVCAAFAIVSPHGRAAIERLGAFIRTGAGPENALESGSSSGPGRP